MPGHKKRQNPEIVAAYGEKVLHLDANSTPELDMLGHPTGVILQAEKLLADAYGASHAFMLVNGSTSGVQYMILTACRPKDKIIMPRNVHKSAINALIMSGAQPVFIAPETDYSYGIMNGVRFENVKKAILQHPDAKAVFLINPTYFGATSDLRAIVKLAHRHKMAVLVDESHGTHFPFHPGFPGQRDGGWRRHVDNKPAQNRRLAYPKLRSSFKRAVFYPHAGSHRHQPFSDNKRFISSYVKH